MSSLSYLALLQILALEGGTVHSMLPGEAPRIATVLVENGRIRAVGTALELPEGARSIDARGMHLAPGLIDGMVHHDPEHDVLYVSAGVTLARDMGNDLGRIFAVRSPESRDAVPGPDLLVCGAVLDGAPPATTEAVVAASPAEVEDKLPRLKALGIDFLAFHSGLPAAAWRRALELAAEHELAIWGPLPRGVGFETLLRSRQDGLLYLEGFVPPGRHWQGIAIEELEGRIEAFAASRLALTPLLGAYASRLRAAGEDEPILALLAPSYAALWTAELESRRRFLTNDVRAAGAGVVALQQELLRSLFEAGVRLVPGSGAPNPWIAPGAGLHEELALWVEAGIPPAEVLRMATQGAAQALGVGEERGVIAPGRVADLLLLAADPTVDFSTLRAPRAVVVRGRLLEAGQLEAMREALRARQALAREQASRPFELEPPELPEGELALAGRAEGSVLGQRIASERYAVVRLSSGGTAYCSRMSMVVASGMPPAETTLVQRIEEGRLASFELAMHRGGSVMTVHGVRVGSQFRIERRIDQVHVDTTSVSENVSLVDSGSVTAALALAHHRLPGFVAGIYFEDAEPAVGRWELERREDGAFLLRSGAGPWAATLRPDGGLERMERLHGSGVLVWEASETETFGGPGMPVPAAGEGARAR